MPPSTREHLLQAAAQLFTQNGYKSVSTRDLADAAEVNLAAINYHFGSKAKLFIEVIHRLMTESGCVEARLDYRGSLNSQADAARALGEYIYGYLNYLLNPVGPHACRMMLREACTDHSSDPEMFETLIASVVEKFLGPLEGSLVKAIAVLCPHASHHEQKALARSISGQCAYYGSHRIFIERLDGKNIGESSSVRALAEAVVRFSFKGLSCSEQELQEALQAIEVAELELAEDRRSPNGPVNYERDKVEGAV
jgi:AcrR family transcriptional regulator